MDTTALVDALRNRSATGDSAANPLAQRGAQNTGATSVDGATQATPQQGWTSPTFNQGRQSLQNMLPVMQQGMDRGWSPGGLRPPIMGMQRQGEGRTPWAAPGTGGGDFLQRPPMQPQGMQMPQPMNMQRPMINSGAMSQRPGLPQQQDPFATQNYLNQAGFGQNLG